MKTDKSKDIVWISGALVESVNEQTASTEDVTENGLSWASQL